MPTPRPGDIVILDNLPVHRMPGVRRAVEQAGASMIFLPPYSPNFNPIETAFSKLKSLVRSRAQRTITALWDAVGEVLEVFTPTECVNFFNATGYEPD